MASLSNTEVGTIVWNMVDGITTGISGILPTIVNQQVYFAQQFTGDSISVDAITETYQPAVISLSVGNVLNLMQAQGLGTKAVKIGELSISKGMNDNSAGFFINDGMSKLNAVGVRSSYYKANG